MGGWLAQCGGGRGGGPGDGLLYDTSATVKPVFGCMDCNVIDRRWPEKNPMAFKNGKVQGTWVDQAGWELTI